MTDFSGQYLGRYRLTERLGEGGMATVYKAYDTRLERDVAVKIIRSSAFPPEILEQILVRFDREAKSLAKLSHPNIVKVYDYGEHGGSPYLVMEYLPGGTLKKFLGKPLPWENALRLFLPVARGVAYAHQRGVLHRDIKPANILITEDEEPMLSDFGIAKLLEVDQNTILTGTGTVIGTPEYMAPEQWNGITSPKSDQYSLGIVLYEMLAGRKPYMADTPAAILLKQATEPLPSPRKFAVDLPEELELVLVKSLARDPDDRHKDLHSFIGALGNIHAGAAVAHPKHNQTEITRAASPRQRVPPPAQEEEEDSLVRLRMEEEATAKARTETERRAKEQANLILATDADPDHLASQETDDKPSATPPPSANEVQVEPNLAPAAVMFDKLDKEGLHPAPRTKYPVSMGLIYGIALFLVLMIAGIGIRTLLSPGTTPSTETPIRKATDGPKTQVTTIIPRTPTSDLHIAVATPAMEIGSSYSYIDGSVLAAVPAGVFTMGDEGKSNPEHRVTLADYWIFSTEVTNQQYALCVSLGKCTAPNTDDNPGYVDYKLANHPVTGVTYEQAANYCEFVKGRLPTEAEWEKAAQSSEGGRYPWGDAPPFCDLLNYNNCLQGMASVVNYKEGASQYGVLNMSGNAFEWVADWYDEAYYPLSPAENPTGPASGSLRSIRSSSYASETEEVAVAVRNSEEPQNHRPDLGFRCVVDDPAYFAPFCRSPLVYNDPAVQGAGSLETCPALEIKPVEVCNGSTPQANITFVGPPEAEIDAQGCTQFSTDPIRFACTSKGRTVSMSAACQLNDPGKPSCLPGYSEEDSVCMVEEKPHTAADCMAGNYDPVKQCCSFPEGQTDLAALHVCPVGTFYTAKTNACLPQPVQEIVTVSSEVTLPACAAAKGGGKGGDSTSGTGCNATQAQINNCNAQAPYYSWNSATCSCEPSN